MTVPLSRLDNRSSLVKVRLGFSKLGGDGPVNSFRQSKQFGKGKAGFSKLGGDGPVKLFRQSKQFGKGKAGFF